MSSYQPMSSYIPVFLPSCLEPTHVFLPTYPYLPIPTFYLLLSTFLPMFIFSKSRCWPNKTGKTFCATFWLKQFNLDWSSSDFTFEISGGLFFQIWIVCIAATANRSRWARLKSKALPRIDLMNRPDHIYCIIISVTRFAKICLISKIRKLFGKFLVIFMLMRKFSLF